MSRDHPLIEHWHGGSTPIALPEGQQDIKRKWKGLVMIQDETDEVTEYEVTYKPRMLLTDFLTAITVVMVDITGDTTPKSVGFKIW